MTIFFKLFNRRQSRILLALVVPILAVSMMFFISRTEAAQTISTMVNESIDEVAQISEITVNSIADIVADDGQCTLREAITAANSDTASGVSSGECPAGSGDDTIVLSAQTYTLTLAGAEEEVNATGDLDITGNLALEVLSGTATIDANQLDRVLHIHPTVTVTITNMIITGGKTPDGIDGADGSKTEDGDGGDGSDSDDGGGIYNAGVLTLINSTVSNNATGHGGDGGKGVPNDEYPPDSGHCGDGGKSGNGGGVYSIGALVLLHSKIINNHTGQGGRGAVCTNFYWFDGDGGASGDGGAIYTTNRLSISHSILSNNRTGHGAPSGHGGGIYTTKRLSISHSTLSHNETGHSYYSDKSSSDGDDRRKIDSGHGGAIYSIDTSELLITSSNIISNTAGNSGGFVSFNTFKIVEHGNGGDGGGIYHAGTGHFIIADSTISHSGL